MSRRWLFAACLSLALLVPALAATPAHASYGPLWSTAVTGAPRLVGDDGGAWLVWTGADGSIAAQRYGRSDGSAVFGGARTLVSGITDLAGLQVAADGSQGLVIAWQDGQTVFVRRFAADGDAVYGAVPVLTADATLTGLSVGQNGAAYVVSTAAAGTDHSLLAAVSGDGVAAGPVAVANGTVVTMAADRSDGSLYVFLAPPGRATIAVQRYDTTLAAQWDVAVSPYSLLSPAPAGATLTPLYATASGSCTVVWRQDGLVRAMRLSADGQRLWLQPSRISVAGDVVVTGDGFGGCMIAGTAGSSLRVHHISVGGQLVGGKAATLDLGLAQPILGTAVVDRSGDLTVSFADDAAYASGFGVARVTYMGEGSVVALTPAQSEAAQLAKAGDAGVYALAGDGVAGSLWRLSFSDRELTLRPQAVAVRYGRSVAFSGFLLDQAEPLSGEPVVLHYTTAGTGETGERAPLTTGADGFYYAASVTPAANATWQAVAPDVAGGAVSSGTVVVNVYPVVTLRLSHLRRGLAEVFSGTVKPGHPGRKVLIQRRRGGAWHTFAKALLDSSSRYRFVWGVPRRTATYTLRVVLPAHADHLKGTSPRAVLRVKIAR